MVESLCVSSLTFYFTMKIIIPMAGLGSRFQKAADTNEEYKKPKPFINVRGIPMVRWATGSLPFLSDKNSNPLTHSDLIFIIREEHNNEHNLETKLKELYSKDIHVIIQNTPAIGATDTVLRAKHLLNEEEEIIITDSDHFFDGAILAERIKNKHENTAGIIPVFVPPQDGIPRWSYSLVTPGTTFTERVAEKDRTLMEAGAYANIGAYYFTKAKYFIELAEEVIAKNQTFSEPGKGEYYIAPLYQLLLDRGHKVEAAVLPEVWGLGTPQDLERFLQETDFEKVRDKVNVGKARVFRNVDHLTFIDGIRPLNPIISAVSSQFKDELNPQDGQKDIFDWILSDLVNSDQIGGSLAKTKQVPEPVKTATDEQVTKPEQEKSEIVVDKDTAAKQEAAAVNTTAQ